jgi:hypothetical protein
MAMSWNMLPPQAHAPGDLLGGGFPFLVGPFLDPLVFAELLDFFLLHLGE